MLESLIFTISVTSETHYEELLLGQGWRSNVIGRSAILSVVL